MNIVLKKKTNMLCMDTDRANTQNSRFTKSLQRVSATRYLRMRGGLRARGVPAIPKMHGILARIGGHTKL